ncbi:protein EPIDERMAL PATTERNING FACTOR [Musa troglodytarum]|uniref:Epidermal patterning factor-like protein n=1 Tax=Musa troglodytarum TaxID=320322 RepID=A0A9E7JTD0_9LILI|nr:protein EPIDERMAL PATTERNING FACTOR [Musa troglodytarum]
MRNCTPSRGVCLLGALFLLSTVCAGLRPNPGRALQAAPFCFAFFVWLETLLLAADAMTAASDDRDNRRRAQDDPISKDTGGDGILKGLYATGSSLPDCSHACGPCSPCKRVTVIFKCSLAESCPVGYRCTCDGKYYHVPSN